MSAISRDEAKARLRAAGLRVTAPRLAVFQLLAKSTKPLSHSEVVEAIASDDWDQATLYRNLLKLVEVDLARVASRVDGINRYDIRGDDEDQHEHPHFTCRVCGEIECLRNARLEGPVDRRWRKAVAASELQLVGDCPGCLARSRKQAARAAR